MRTQFEYNTLKLSGVIKRIQVKLILTLIFSAICLLSDAQSADNLILKGNYSYQDSLQVTNSYINAQIAVGHMYNAMNDIWRVEGTVEKSIKIQRKERWKEDEDFMRWLGEPTNMRKARRKIKKIHSKFQGKFILEVVKEDEGRCGRFVSAWAVPYGKVKIRLCRNFTNFGPQNQSKTVIHEIGHEAGLLFDRGVYHCRSAISVAANSKKNRATRRPENYAWLAMSYIGMECNTRRYVSPQSY